MSATEMLGAREKVIVAGREYTVRQLSSLELIQLAEGFIRQQKLDSLRNIRRIL